MPLKVASCLLVLSATAAAAQDFAWQRLSDTHESPLYSTILLGKPTQLHVALLSESADGCTLSILGQWTRIADTVTDADHCQQNDVEDAYADLNATQYEAFLAENASRVSALLSDYGIAANVRATAVVPPDSPCATLGHLTLCTELRLFRAP